MNIWEFQKEQLRKNIAQDNANFYTYAKDYLSLAFPRVNEYEIAQNAKLDNEKGWKTKNGFDILNKKEFYNEHPKRPPQSIIDDLTTMPYHIQKMEAKQKLTDPGHIYIDQADRPEFIPKVKGVQTFSDPKFFKTVFVSGDDMVAEENAIRQKEIDDWNKKVVVANKHFFVNTKPSESQQVEKYRNLREGNVQKIGFRLGAQKLGHLTER